MIKLPFWVFRSLYWYLDILDKDHQLAFMNFGYSETGKDISLEGKDEFNRYPIQLYHHVAVMVDLFDKKVVEVGSGRGGGLSYISTTFQPVSSTGVDIDKGAVAFSNRMFGNERLRYLVGNAQKLPLSDKYCDIVINVESSHRYVSMISFLKEVHRILNPGGHFLFTDFRRVNEWPETIGMFEEAGLSIVRQNDITINVLEALGKDSSRREKLIKKYALAILRNSILNFSGVKGTATYEHFLNRKFVYMSFLLKKN